MANSFSTASIAAPDRLGAWYATAKKVCGDCRFHFPKRYPFQGSIDRRTVGGFDLTRFASSPLSFEKFPMVSANSPDRCYLVITQIKGVRRYCQDRAVAVLSAGDTTLVDAGRPWLSECAGHCARLYLRVPLWLAENRLRLNPLPVLPQVRGASGLGAALFRLASSLYEQAEILTPEEGMAAIEAYLDILAGCIGRRDAAAQTGSGLCSRIEQFIETHLAEPALNPAEVASAAGISVRHLQRLFAGKGSTVAEWIRERRLERCRTDLSDPRFSRKSITEISFLWGFSDSAHFSRSFKFRFGVSPRAFRSREWADSWGAEQERLPAPASIRPSRPN